MDESLKSALNESINGKKDLEDKILSMIKEDKGGLLRATKWYRDTHGGSDISLADAKAYVESVARKNNFELPKPKGGCVVTILIAITTTLSAFFIL